MLGTTLRVLAYVESAAKHIEVADGGFFAVSSGKFSCRFCHPGEPYPQPAEADPLVNKYRCIACHYDNPNTRDIVEAIAQSNHRSLICRECHDIYHEGHSTYKSVGDIYPGYYGCAGGKCHYVVSEQLYPPANPTNLFAWVVFLNKTAIKGYELEARFFFTTQAITGDRGIFPSSFIDPLDLDPNIPIKSRLYEECLSCHKMAPKASKDDVPDPYTLSSNGGMEVIGHTDKCYHCHATNLSRNAAGFPLAPHSIAPIGRGPNEPPWGYCVRCHVNLAQAVAQSVHASIGCRCHPILHEAGWNRTAAWLHVYYPNTPDVIVPSPPSDWGTWKHIFFYDSINASVYGILLGPISYNGNYTYLTPYYALYNDATYITASAEKWIICFNCHFYSGGPSSAATYESFGLWMKRYNDPHSIRLLTTHNKASAALHESKYLSGIKTATSVAAVIALISIIIMLRNPATRTSNPPQ